MKRRNILLAMAGVLAVTLVPVVSAFAQTGKSGIEEKFPEKAIRIVVPSTPVGLWIFSPALSVQT